MNDAKLKAVRFTAELGPDGIRFRSDGTGRSGEYVPAEIAADLLAACEAFLAGRGSGDVWDLAADAVARARGEARS